ncbi:MAG: transcription antitermination factor NusB [Pseudobdellovibrio sp.]
MRRQSRELALQILFQTEFAPQMSLSDLASVFDKTFEEQTLKYTYELVRTVQANKEKLDVKIQSASRHWKVERMASVDRNLLRLALSEIFFTPELIEPKIAINEAIEIAKIYGTEESASFVNGILDQVIRNEK